MFVWVQFSVNGHWSLMAEILFTILEKVTKLLGLNDSQKLQLTAWHSMNCTWIYSLYSSSRIAVQRKKLWPTPEKVCVSRNGLGLKFFHAVFQNFQESLLRKRRNHVAFAFFCDFSLFVYSTPRRDLNGNRPFQFIPVIFALGTCIYNNICLFI